MAISNSWTAVKVSQLKTLFGKGLSTATIGKKLGMTKNAVVGKINRMGLNSMEKSAGQKTSAPKILAPMKKVSSRGPKRKPKRVANNHAALIALGADQCRWPIGDPDSEQFHFCAAKCFAGKPYCFEHCKAAYQFAPPMKRK